MDIGLKDLNSVGIPRNHIANSASDHSTESEDRLFDDRTTTDRQL